jgi:hypothetical protein
LGHTKQIDANRIAPAWRCAIALCITAILLWPASGARAANRIYWSNFIDNTISWENLDGSGGGNLNTTGATVYGPMGMTIDPAAGRLYWSNYGNDPAATGHTISWANLDGSGGGDLATAAPVDGPHGMAIDPAAGRLYWPNYDNDTIAYANLDGSGGGVLATGGATVIGPRGVAIDRVGQRIYWANWDGNAISYANLDGSGGADLNSGTATVVNPEGVALDGAGRLYYSNFTDPPNDRISYLNLNGGGGADLDTSPVTPDHPHGVAIDPGAGRIYWADFDANAISFANLGGGGGGTLTTTGPGPDLPALLEVPDSEGGPAIGGKPAPGSVLHCTQGKWAPDLLASLLYRAPQSFSYAWSKNGNAIPGATSSTITASSVGNYRCRVTARNEAGSGSVTSRPDGVFRIGRPKLNRRRGTARLPVRVPGPGTLTLQGRRIIKQRAYGAARASSSHSRRVAAGTVKLLVEMKRDARKRLNRRGRARVGVKVTYTPTGGAAGSQHKAVKLKKKPRR